MKTYLLIAAAAVFALLAINGHLQKVERMAAEKKALGIQLQAAQEQTRAYEQAIQHLQADLLAERETQAALQQAQSELSRAHDNRAMQLKRLKNENEQLKNWAAVELPDSVKCLRHRPAITTAADYTAWLSGSDSLPAACQ